MSVYFDIRNDAVAVIETDAPETGWIKLTPKQSRLAARYRVEAGKVVDAIPARRTRRCWRPSRLRRRH